MSYLMAIPVLISRSYDLLVGQREETVEPFDMLRAERGQSEARH